MKIVGPDELVFGVDSLEACAAFLADYGLKHAGEKDGSGFYEALDGTGLSVYHKDDPSLPPPLPTNNMLRKTIYGVEDQATLVHRVRVSPRAHDDSAPAGSGQR